MASMRMLLLAAALGAAAELAAETVSFERYQPLVDRYPFGEPPEGFDPDKMSSEVSKSAASAKPEALTGEQAEIAKNVTFSVINKEPDGTVRVGFSDNADPKQPHHYYMGVGETRDGWTVKEADPVEKTMKLVSKDGVEVSLELGGSSSGKDSSKSTAGAGGGAMRGNAGRSSLLGPGSGGSAAGSFKSARRARQEREAEEAAARKRAAEEEMAKRAEADAIERDERALRAEELAEQRRQLEILREELRKNREARDARDADKNEGSVE